MRIYIIGNDGITLCREAPGTVSEGEIAVASNEELHAAPLNGKRLLELWNALPGIEKRRKVGDREALIDQRRPQGATIDEVAKATGWQRHTVRGVFSGTLKKKLGLTMASAKQARGRVYRIPEPTNA